MNNALFTTTTRFVPLNFFNCADHWDNDGMFVLHCNLDGSPSRRAPPYLQQNFDLLLDRFGTSPTPFLQVFKLKSVHSFSNRCLLSWLAKKVRQSRHNSYQSLPHKRFTHFQVIFQQAGIYIPPVSLRVQRGSAHLLVMFNAWTSQRLMKFSLPVGHNCKHLKSRTRVRLVF